MRKKTSKPNDIVTIFCIFVGLLCSGSALSICIENFAIPLLLSANIILITYILIKNNGKILLSKSKEITSLYIFMIFIILSFVMNFSISGITTWIRLLLTLSLVGILVSRMSFEKLASYYIDIIRFVAIIALIGYTIFVIIGVPTSILPTINKVTSGGVSYQSVGIYGIWTSEFTRNCGPFWEPSIFAAYLSIALIFVFFYDNRPTKRFNIILFSIAILTTQSTGGYLLLIIFIIMAIWKNKNTTSIILSIVTILGGIVIILAWEPICLWLLNLNYNVFSKLVYFEKMGTSMTRYYSVLINLRIWVENNLLFGVGLADIDNLYVHYRDIIAPVTLAPAQTSTSTLMVASVGVGGIYYFYLWIKSILIQKMSIVPKTLFLFCIIFILNQTPHTYFFLTYYLLFTILKSGTGDKLRENN